MKQATILLRLTKDHEVFKNNVTPVECLILAALHHKNSGGSPIEVNKDTITNTGHYVTKDKEVDEDYIVVQPNGTKVIQTKKVKKAEQVWEDDKRGIDDEVNRLRLRYSASVIKTMLAEVREIPTEDFDLAIKKGINMVIPTGSLTQQAIGAATIAMK